MGAGISGNRDAKLKRPGIDGEILSGRNAAHLIRPRTVRLFRFTPELRSQQGVRV